MSATATAADLDDALARYRSELTAYCYRMLGSAAEADDAVQDALLRAWRGFGRFEGRAGLRSWLYRIATNVCLDMLRGRSGRAMPMDLAPAADGRAKLGAPREARQWVEPIPDSMINRPEADPAEVITSRESVRLAFVSALQYLGPRQRAVLILRDVLRWRAAEVADLLDTSVDAANSTLRRARAALRVANADAQPAPAAPVEEALLARYVDAFERFDIDSLVSLLREDATVSMPPYELWLDGREAFRHWLRSGVDCGNSRVIPTRANRCPAIAVYRPSGTGSAHQPYAIHVLEPAGDQIAAVHIFLDPGVFGPFQLPASIS